MFHAPAATWNRIAEHELQSDLAQRLFPLPEEELAEAIDAELEELTATQTEGDEVLAAAFLKVAPSLWEREAIRAYRAETLDPEPPIAETVDEALAIADGDYHLSEEQRDRLEALLLIRR